MSWYKDTSSTTIVSDFFCNNCGKAGHSFHQCKMPITSNGIIVFRIHPTTLEREYLMIRRKDTLGYMDFMRGKFPIYQKNYIMNMLKQMTVEEKKKLRMRMKEGAMKEKIQILMNGVVSNSERYDLVSLLDESDQYETWTEPEWGFPKGRRNNYETDIMCALREYEEETGYDRSDLNLIRNIMPYEEIFIGSNYKSYKHKYFIARSKGSRPRKKFQASEVSNLQWFTFEEVLEKIRPYNVERIQMITLVHSMLREYVTIN